MRRIAVLLGLFGSGLLLLGCDAQDRSFTLPPGDVERGEKAFVGLRCNACHSVKGSLDRLRDGGHPEIYVQLGGEVTRVMTYEDLVTSIIDPSHRMSRGPDPRHRSPDGESKMPRYNEVMTVQQLIDITTYLSSKYSVWTHGYAYGREQSPD